MSSFTRILLAATLSLWASSATAADLSTAYNECTDAMGKGAAAAADALAKCESPAMQGVPGAQYAMGVLLVTRESPAEINRGIEWLEKAVSGGSIPAAYYLAGVLAERQDADSKNRGRELAVRAICARYPPALADLAAQGGNEKSFQCAPAPNTDFDGEWIVAVKWDKASPSEPRDSYKIAPGKGSPRVYVRVGDD